MAKLPEVDPWRYEIKWDGYRANRVTAEEDARHSALSTSAI